MSDTVTLLREAKNAHVTDSDVEQYKGIVSPMKPSRSSKNQLIITSDVTISKRQVSNGEDGGRGSWWLAGII